MEIRWVGGEERFVSKRKYFEVNALVDFEPVERF